MRSESMSNFSSIADVPDHLERQYVPLGEVFQSHGLSLPQRTPPESNSAGKHTATHIRASHTSLERLFFAIFT